MAGGSGGATASTLLIYGIAPHPATPRLSRDVEDVNAYDPRYEQTVTFVRQDQAEAQDDPITASRTRS